MSNTRPLKRFVDYFELGEQTMIDFAFAGFLGHEVPEMADLLLANAVDAPEALFEAVRIPRQVVIDHEIGVLEVHAFTGSIGGEKDTDFGVGTEQGLAFPAFVAVRAAVNGNDGVGRAEDAADFPLQIVQGVAVLGEDYHLALATTCIAHVGIVLENFREFVPFAIKP